MKNKKKKRNMLKIGQFLLLPAVIIVFLTSGQAVAQSGYSVNDQIAKFKTELNLNQGQSRKVAILLVKMDEKRTSDNDKFSDNPEASRKAARKRRQRFSEDMKLVLDKDQFEKFQKMNLRSPNERTARQIKGLTEALTLTDDQVAKVTDVYEKYQPEFEQIFGSFRTGSDSDRQAGRAKMGELRQKMSTEIQALLTEEQVEKYKKYLEENRSRRRQGGHQRGM